MEMHQLRYVVAVAQKGNFSRAAELCHVSQPSLSHPLRVHVESMRPGRHGKEPHAKGPLHPRAFQVLAQRGNSSMLSRQFAELLAQAGLREKTTRASQGKTRSVRRQVNALSFHSLRWTATTLLH